MNTVLWVLQGLLAAALLVAGMTKVALPRRKLALKMRYVNDFTDGQVKLIGLAEVLGALGLVLPMALHIAPMLTPVAAACATVLMLGAIVVHLRRKEPMMPAAVLAVLSTVVALGRFLTR